MWILVGCGLLALVALGLLGVCASVLSSRVSRKVEAQELVTGRSAAHEA